MRDLSATHTGRIHWPTLAAVVLVHGLALCAPFATTTTAIVLAALLYGATQGAGIALGYHRMLAHGSFETSRFTRFAIALLATLAWQGGPITWVRTHRLHHVNADGPGDPHSPRHGFWWSHCRWLLMDQHRPPETERLVRDLRRDRLLVGLDRFAALPQLFLVAVLFVSGDLACAKGLDASGASWVVWGVGVRTVLSYQVTWFVNSAAHCWGPRGFDTPDDSRNVWWLSLLGFGEGWHNNHHASPSRAAHGLGWRQPDPTYWLIRGLERLGIVWRVRTP